MTMLQMGNGKREFSADKHIEYMKAVAGAVILGLLIVGPCAYRSSEETLVITVQDKERVAGRTRDDSSRYLLWTEHETFCVADTLSYGDCYASDRYGKLLPGHTYRVRVAGWRIGILSQYRNIISSEEIE